MSHGNGVVFDKIHSNVKLAGLVPIVRLRKCKPKLTPY
jgi:hypothetical protein